MNFRVTVYAIALCAVMFVLPSPPAVVATGAAQSSGSVVVDPSGANVYVVNPESGFLSVIDARSDRLIGEVEVGLDSHCLALSPDGRYLYITGEASGLLKVIDTITMRPRAAIPVGAAPYGVVTGPVGDLVYVASSALSVVDVLQLRIDEDSIFQRHVDSIRFRRPGPQPVAASLLARIPVLSKPKGLAISGDGTRLYVTHFLTGEVSVIDTLQRSVVEVISTGIDSNMSQKIVIHPGDGRAYLPHIRSHTGNPSLLFDTTVFPLISVVDLTPGRGFLRGRLDLSLGRVSANLPFDLAISPGGNLLYAASLGSGDVAVMDIATQRRLGRIDVGDGPRGIAVTPDGRKAYVLNSLSDDVSVLDLGRMEELLRIKIAPSPLPPQIHRGKVLFFSSHSTDVSRDRWMSCASCHFEGGIDGRTWRISAGPRNTQTLEGIADSLPLHWSADRDEVQDFEFTIRTLQAGGGLIRGQTPNLELGSSNAGLSEDLDALAAYVLSIKRKPSPFALDGPAIERGREIFSSPGVGCNNCHPPPRYTDSSMSAYPFTLHDVGTGDNPAERMGSAFDTPSLRGIWDTAPYLHDGSASNLRGVLRTRNPQDRHGRTSQLNESELNDLAAFLLSL